jgi:hypothetical protein
LQRVEVIKDIPTTSSHKPDVLIFDRNYLNGLNLYKSEVGKDCMQMQMMAARVIIEKKNGPFSTKDMENKLVCVLRDALYINPNREFVYGIALNCDGFRILRVERRTSNRNRDEDFTLFYSLWVSYREHNGL